MSTEEALHYLLATVAILAVIGIPACSFRIDRLAKRVKALETTLDHLGLYDDGGLR